MLARVLDFSAPAPTPAHPQVALISRKHEQLYINEQPSVEQVDDPAQLEVNEQVDEQTRV